MPNWNQWPDGELPRPGSDGPPAEHRAVGDWHDEDADWVAHRVRVGEEMPLRVGRALVKRTGFQTSARAC